VNKPQPFLRLAAVFAALTTLAVWGIASRPASAPLAPPASAAPGSVHSILHIQPFRLAESYTHKWRAEQPAVRSGFLVVLEVDAAAFTPRQGLEPVLQFGAETVQRINHGHLDGRLIGLVPAAAAPDGWPLGDLSSAAPFLAAPALPEQLLSATAQQSWTSASTAALAAHAAHGARATLTTQRLDLAGYNELLRAAGNLILLHAPGESELAEALLMPRLR
jgi:hypothetical protein